jgi:hypothetical protein
LAWTEVSKVQFIPNEILQLRVIVKVDDFITQQQQGQVEDYVQAYVDEASISIVDTSIVENVYGKGALITQIYEVDEGQQSYNYAELISAISAHGASISP